ncbi:MAG: hypothetical protein DMG57_33050 [Acidobacteria bacterium]|nr:MAG: hypothetical protein DMG57_33050 [Acidobacteriota bacterium]
MPLTRRHCLKTFAGTFGMALAAGSSASRMFAAQVSSKADSSKLAMPGLFRGRVVAVEHPGCIIAGRYQAEPVQQMMRKGMRELTGADASADAWRMFVQPGDIVGIKVNPVGQPHVISAAEVVREIIAGLNAAGIKNKDIVVYDRYHDQFFKAGFDKWLPDGVRTSNAVADYEDVQQSIEGYDPDHYMDMALALPGQDATNLTARRSYAANFISKEVNKLINLPVLKDHQSAGVTLALKNLSHGLVNNVCRSHSSNTLNACGSFIPAVVSMPVIRNRTVLHVLDGVKGLYHGGPGARPQFVWEHRTLYFATDPVALDHICWKAIDQKRSAMGLQTVAEARPDKYSTFLSRQPEHIEIAGALGLGEWNESKIDIRRIRL